MRGWVPRYVYDAELRRTVPNPDHSAEIQGSLRAP
jgi:hypothetical protein